MTNICISCLQCIQEISNSSNNTNHLSDVKTNHSSFKCFPLQLLRGLYILTIKPFLSLTAETQHVGWYRCLAYKSHTVVKLLFTGTLRLLLYNSLPAYTKTNTTNGINVSSARVVISMKGGKVTVIHKQKPSVHFTTVSSQLINQ